MNPRSRRLAGWVPSLDPLEDRALLSPLAGPVPTFSRDVTIAVASWQPRSPGPVDLYGAAMAPPDSHGGPMRFDGFGGGRMHEDSVRGAHQPLVVVVPHGGPHADGNASGQSQSTLASLLANGGAASAATSNGVAGPATASNSGEDRAAPVSFTPLRFAPPAFASHASPPGTAASAPTPDASLQGQAAPATTVSATSSPDDDSEGAAVLAPPTATADLPVITQAATGAFLAATRPFSSSPQDPSTRPAPLTLPAEQSADPATPAETPPVPASTGAATSEEAPEPVGADLIAELSPLDSSSLEAALSGLIARFDGLESGLPHADGDGNLRLAPIALGVAAFEVARRWWNSRPEAATRRSWKTRSTLLRGFF